MRRALNYQSIGLLVVLLASLFLVTACYTRKLDANDQVLLAPYQTEVYFLMETPTCLMAYVPEHSLCVNVKIQPNVTKPYVEVSKMKNSDFMAGAKGEFIAWGFGGTLCVKDLEQLKKLLLVK